MDNEKQTTPDHFWKTFVFETAYLLSQISIIQLQFSLYFPYR